MYPYLNELNQVQRKAVEAFEGPSLVIAGAGSGKTRVLTYRITHLLNIGKHPSSILSLTFTNKAAREMKNRIGKIVGEKTARYLWMGTFHSIFAKILRIESKFINYPSSFSIYDAQDSKNLIKTICKEQNLDPKVYKANEVLNRISSAKNNLITASNYANNFQIKESDKKSRKPEIYKIYQIYENRCRTAGAMDFDDLLLKTNILFDQFPEVLEKYQNKFQYVLVDEYQDTNFSQYLIIKKLANTHHNLCVVGDDAQSIYAFRGARIENILNFKKDYPENKVFKLEQNYRSTQNIVEAANSVIDKNKNQIKKNVFSKNEAGNKIKLFEAYTDHEEGYFIANMINDIRFREHDAFSDFAILYRTNAQSRILEEALRKKNIPYKIYGGLSFYQRKEIKDLLAYFRLIINPLDDEAFKRIINYPKRGIGNTSLNKLLHFAKETNLSIWQAALKLKDVNINLGNAVIKKIYGFLGIISNFAAVINTGDAYEVARQVAVDTGILRELHNDKTPEGISRHQNVQEILNGIREFTSTETTDEGKPNLVDYIENVSLLTNDDKNTENDNDKVVLMTIHSSKGLEFKNVFLAGLEEELFPSKFSSANISELEEERRLFYVAITRAEKNICISYAKSRYRWGDLAHCVPSRFIRDINPEFIEQESPVSGLNSNYKKDNKFKTGFEKGFGGEEKKTYPSFKKTTEKGTAYKSKLKKVNADINIDTNKTGSKNNIDGIAVGAKVKHLRFGLGKVLDIEGDFPNVKATIEFNSAGKKQLLLKFAKLIVIK
ncbi:MAG: ATP-dependent DNA helicase [Bacteroidetes bacterium 4572_117]|nr:MAG: ATP-dependent DNA helicase [Bacteroidetes bacterium 4572_117]